MATNKYERTKNATAARKEKIAAGTLIKLDPLEKAKANPNSLRAAINGKCWECVQADVVPRPRQLIRNCSDTNCPLHQVRPYQHAIHGKPNQTHQANNKDKN